MMPALKGLTAFLPLEKSLHGLLGANMELRHTWPALSSPRFPVPLQMTHPHKPVLKSSTEKTKVRGMFQLGREEVREAGWDIYMHHQLSVPPRGD